MMEDARLEHGELEYSNIPAAAARDAPPHLGTSFCFLKNLKNVALIIIRSSDPWRAC